MEAHKLRIIERKDVKESIQALQTQTWKRHVGSEKSKGKYDKGKNKKGSWTNSQKHKNDEKPKSSEKGGEKSNHKNNKFQDKKSFEFYNYEK